MKYSLLEIQEYVSKLVEVIAEVLTVEVEIVDANLIRVAGTGRYKEKISVSIEGEGFIYRKAIETGRKQVVENPGLHKLCADCNKRNCCLEKFECCTPIKLESNVIGVIGLICFTDEQKRIILKKFKEYFNFLDKIADLIAAKARENYFIENNHIPTKPLQEAMNVAYAHAEGNRMITFNSMLGKEEEFLKVQSRAKKVSKGNASVLIIGESGTGKELFAKAIHYESSQRKGPFVAINCSAIPDTLMESELFGYVPGAFTGAAKGGKIGKFELANRGTLFLDEIGDMPLHLQAKLLRVLQERMVVPIGSNKPVPIEVRIISATHRNLEQMVSEGQFREDLYYRLNVIPIEIPPLRKRKEDLPLLIHSFLRKYCGYYNLAIPKISEEAINKLKAYNWPGNIRELENSIEYVINLLQEGEEVREIHLPPRIIEYLVHKKGEVGEKSIAVNTENFNLEEIEKKAILEALQHYGSHTTDKKRIARALGISLATLYRKMKKYRLVE